MLDAIITALGSADPVQLITQIIAILGVAGTIITSIQVKKYIGIIQLFLDIPLQVVKGDADGNRTDEDIMSVGKATYALTDALDKDERIPVSYNKE